MPKATLTIRQDLQALLAWLWPAAQELPPEVLERAQRLWLDTVSCACAGLRADVVAHWLRQQAVSDAGPVPMPGSSVRLGAGAAATTFAIAACWDEACEGLAVAHGRPGVPVVAALWPALVQGQHDWLAVWRATAVGYEVAARLGARLRIRPGMHVDGTWGAFGAAVARVHLAGGGPNEALRAIEACAVQLPFSLYRPVREGANVRNLYLGHSAWLGVQAAQAVAAGFDTPAGAVDDFAALALKGGPSGHWPAPGLWLLLQSYWKPFAAVRHVHYGAQAALELRPQLAARQLGPTDIHDVELRVYPEAEHYCGNRAPDTVLAAQFSLSYGVAAALVHGDLSPSEFRAPRFMDSAVRRIESVVQVTVDEHTFPPPARGATLTVHAGGTRWEARCDGIAGDPGRQPDQAAVLNKFHRYSDDDVALGTWAQHVLHDTPQAPACLPAHQG